MTLEVRESTPIATRHRGPHAGPEVLRAHLVDRPGMPLVALTIARGRRVWSAPGLES